LADKPRGLARIRHPPSSPSRVTFVRRRRPARRKRRSRPACRRCTWGGTGCFDESEDVFDDAIALGDYPSRDRKNGRSSCSRRSNEKGESVDRKEALGKFFLDRDVIPARRRIFSFAPPVPNALVRAFLASSAEKKSWQTSEGPPSRWDSARGSKRHCFGPLGQPNAWPATHDSRLSRRFRSARRLDWVLLGWPADALRLRSLHPTNEQR